MGKEVEIIIRNQIIIMKALSMLLADIDIDTAKILLEITQIQEKKLETED